MATKDQSQYPYLRFTDAASDPGQQQINPALLTRLNQVAQATGNVIDIFSGRRPTDSKFGYSNDPHQRGEAVDARVGGRDIGYVIPLGTLAKYGLEGGNSPGFWSNPKNSNPTGADPEHVQIPGSGVNKSLMWSPGGSNTATPPVATPTPTTSAPSAPGGDSALLRALYLDPAHPDVTVGPYTKGALTGDSLVRAIVESAQDNGVDPRVPLSVAPHEGGLEATGYGDWGYYSGGKFVSTQPHAPGSSPTSFGPFALHEGGALPQAVWDKGTVYANRWANSEAGIDYAMKGIAGAVGKTGGLAGVASQVQNYERPSSQYLAGEIAKAQGTYKNLAGLALPTGDVTAAPQPGVTPTAGPGAPTVPVAPAGPSPQQLAAQKVSGLGRQFALSLTGAAQSMLNGGTPNLPELFGLAKNFQQAQRALGPAPLGKGTPLTTAAGARTA